MLSNAKSMQTWKRSIPGSQPMLSLPVPQNNQIATILRLQSNLLQTQELLIHLFSKFTHGVTYIHAYYTVLPCAPFPACTTTMAQNYSFLVTSTCIVHHIQGSIIHHRYNKSLCTLLSFSMHSCAFIIAFSIVFAPLIHLFTPWFVSHHLFTHAFFHC